MFENPFILQIVLGMIGLGVFYLVATRRTVVSTDENRDESELPGKQVQCPNCQRWKKMGPIRREELLDEVEALKRSVLHNPQHRFLYEYRCRFCGHVWQEHYPV